MGRALPPSPEISSMTPSANFPSQMEKGDLSPLDEGKFYSVTEEDDTDLSPNIFQKLVAEFMGTFILLFIGCGSGFIDQRYNITIVGIALAWGLVIVAMVYTLGHISGAHFNPAVTVAFAVIGRFPWKQVVLYVMVQVIGAILACLILRWLFNGDRPTVMLTLPAANTDDLTVFAWELLTSFLLMWVICGAASDPRAIKELSGAAIGTAIFLDVLIAGKITGASMNPARTIGPAVAAHNYRKLWIYMVAPFVGTVAAASLYNLLRSPDELQKNSSKNATRKIKSILNPAYSSGKEAELP